MGQISLVILLAIAGWLAWHRLRRLSARFAQRVERNDPRRTVTLEKDPRTGVYRPRDS